MTYVLEGEAGAGMAACMAWLWKAASLPSTTSVRQAGGQEELPSSLLLIGKQKA